MYRKHFLLIFASVVSNPTLLLICALVAAVLYLYPQTMSRGVIGSYLAHLLLTTHMAHHGTVSQPLLFSLCISESKSLHNLVDLK